LVWHNGSGWVLKKDLDPDFWDDFVSLAQSYASIMQGDVYDSQINSAYAIMKKYGLDEYGHPPEDEEDDTPVYTNNGPKPKKASD
jgi:hypothetical protein